MDPLVHTLLGFTVCEAIGPSSLYESGAIAASIAGAIIPDCDFVIRPLGPSYTIRFHHGPTHSIFFGLFLSLLCALMVTYVPKIFLNSWAPSIYILWIFAYLGFLSHILLDSLVHCNGLKIFWPFSRKWFRIPIFVGLNPLTASARCAESSLIVCWICQLHSLILNRFFYILIISFILQLIFWSHRQLISIFCIIILFSYSMWTFYKKNIASKIACNIFNNIKNLELFPSNFGTNHWLAVSRTKNGFATLNINLNGNIYDKITYFPYVPSLQLEKVSQDINVKSIINNFIVPYGVISSDTENQNEIYYWDLAYFFTPNINLHLAKIKVGNDGQVSSIDFRERW